MDELWSNSAKRKSQESERVSVSSVVKKTFRSGIYLFRFLDANVVLLFYALKWYNCVVMKMVVPKISDNFQRTEGCKMISLHHFHPTNGVRPADSNVRRYVESIVE